MRLPTLSSKSNLFNTSLVHYSTCPFPGSLTNNVLLLLFASMTTLHRGCSWFLMSEIVARGMSCQILQLAWTDLSNENPILYTCFFSKLLSAPVPSTLGPRPCRPFQQEKPLKAFQQLHYRIFADNFRYQFYPRSP